MNSEKFSEIYYSSNLNYYGNILVSLFLIVSFLDRKFASIILIGLLIFLIYFYIKTFDYYEYKHIYNSVIYLIASICIINFFYHEASAKYIDNFSRLLILLPLLTLRYNDELLEKTVILISLIALFHYYFVSDSSNLRYMGTSNTAITYGHMITIIICINIYQLLFNKNTFYRKLLLFLSLLALLFLFSKNHSAGPIIGLFTFALVIIFKLKNKLFFLVLLIPVITIIFSYSPLGSRFDGMYKDLKNIDESYLYDSSSNKSLRERILYGIYSINTIKDKPVSGIGPQNITQDIRTFMISNGYAAEKNTHVHNDYFDIAVKYGLVPLLALIYFYYVIFRIFRKDRNTLGLIILLLILCASFTQSHFIHHQSVIFCTTLLYMFVNINKRDMFSRK